MVRADERPRRHYCQKRFSSHFSAVTHGQLTNLASLFQSARRDLPVETLCGCPAGSASPEPSSRALKHGGDRRYTRVCRFLSSGRLHLVQDPYQGSSLRPKTEYGCRIPPLSRAYTINCAKHDCLLIINDPQTNEVRATGGSDRHVRSKCQ